MIKDFFAASPGVAWSIVSVLIAVSVIALVWETVKWWWHNTWYRFPLIGKLTSLARTQSAKEDDGWTQTERTLCLDYLKFHLIQDEHDFNEKKTYLRKARENSRREMPGLLWILTIALVFVEAMGFSYVLAGYTIPGASENMQQVGAYGIAFLVSVILVAFTHYSGHELYVSSKIKNSRREWIEGGRKTDLYGSNISLDMPQSTDDNQPGYSQMLNRFENKHTSYKITGITAMLVLLVAIGATYVRGQVLEQMLIEETTGQVIGTSQATGGDALNLSAKSDTTQLPDADLKNQRDAEKKAADETRSAKAHGGWGTFIVLAFIFVFLQILGIIFGLKYGFAAEESKAAFYAIGKGRYTVYADVRAHYKQISNVAQAMLADLQRRCFDGEVNGMAASQNKTFVDFMSEHRAEDTKDRENERQHKDQRIRIDQTKNESKKPEQLTVEIALKNLDELADKEAKQDYLDTLPEGLEMQVTEALRVRKQRESELITEQKAQRRAERDSLFE